MSDESDICGDERAESSHVRDLLGDVLFDLYTMRTLHPLNSDEVIRRCENKLATIIALKFGAKHE